MGTVAQSPAIPYSSSMATISTIADDFDGSTPAERRTFAFAGKDYAIDLSDENNEKLEAIFSELGDKLAPYLEKARPLGKPPRASSKPSRSSYDAAAVREWATAQGLEVSDRGRISRDVLEAYESRKK